MFILVAEFTHSQIGIVEKDTTCLRGRKIETWEGIAFKTSTR